MKTKSKRLAFLSVCTALSLIFSYVETLLPPLFAAVPGIKLGLANIAVVFVLYRFGVPAAGAVSFVRIALSSLLFGSAMTFLYSVAGALLSLLGMAILKRVGIFSEVGVSVAGGVLHNAGQILVAIFMLETVSLGYYMIVLAFTGTISGVFIGLAAAMVLKRLPHMKI